MQFDVAQLLREPIGSERAYTIPSEILALEPEQTAQAGGEVRVTRTDKGVWVHGSIDAIVATQCSRCLKNVTERLSFDLDEEYLQRLDLVSSAPVSEDDTDLDSFKLDDRHTLDLREAIRQYIIASQPMSPVCKATCTGLCPQCGTDLNRRQCSCSREQTDSQLDPRWSALRELMPKNQKTNQVQRQVR